jgi:hypothetical protein
MILYLLTLTSKTRTCVYVKEVIVVLRVRYLRDTIKLRREEEQWFEIMEGFERICGVPDVCGAMDGSLVLVKRFFICCSHTYRFKDFEGWYSHKHTPCFNVQAVVDDKKRFISYSIRSGSQNDKQMFNKSVFGKICHSIIPRGGMASVLLTPNTRHLSR